MEKSTLIQFSVLNADLIERFPGSIPDIKKEIYYTNYAMKFLQMIGNNVLYFPRVDGYILMNI